MSQRPPPPTPSDGDRMKPRGFRQARCPGCGLTLDTCLCAAFGRLKCPTAISVVMSRAEARSASNSARLLSLWLPDVQLHVRGGHDELRDPEALATRPGSALLFPSGGAPLPLPGDVHHLIVPDGTWAQARRIERRWFAPLALPRVALSGPWPSAYGLRRGRDGLCTFEAVAIALGLLHDPTLAATLLHRFSDWERRARSLKGGAPALPASTSSPPAPHPAIALLNAAPKAPSPVAPNTHREP